MSRTHAVGYLRTSSLSNVGDDQDSEKRQRAAITSGAKRLGCKIFEWFYDAGISGDVAVNERPAFAAMLDRIDGNSVRMVLVESADRFARKMLTAELGILLLIHRNVTLLTATGEDLTNTTDEMRIAFRQMAMTFAQLEKTRLVKKLKVARDRASQKAGRRVEGKKGYTRGDPALVAKAKALRGQGQTLLAVSQALAAQGHVTTSGRPFSATQIKRLVEAR